MAGEEVTQHSQCAIENVPKELLLRVAEKLDKKVLLALALLSKRFCDVAQDFLYRVIELPLGKRRRRNGDKYDEEISGLLSTVSKKAHLRRKVQSLDFLPSTSHVPYEMEFLSSISAEARMGLVSSEKTIVRVKESTLAGRLLCLLPGLRYLGIGRIHLDPNCRPLGICSSEMGILRELDICPDKILLIAGFANLRSFTLGAGTLQWPICTLPALEEVLLGPVSRSRLRKRSSEQRN